MECPHETFCESKGAYERNHSIEQENAEEVIEINDEGDFDFEAKFDVNLKDERNNIDEDSFIEEVKRDRMTSGFGMKLSSMMGK